MVALDSLPGAAHAAERLRSEEMIWITTVRPAGQPQTSAVWFHWDGTDFLVVSQPAAAKLRNIAAQPRVSLNLNGTGYGADLVVVEGRAEVVPDYAGGPWPEPARVDAYYAKYARPLREVLKSSGGDGRCLQHGTAHHPHPLAREPLGRRPLARGHAARRGGGAS
jgi:PPOX class probable F420-dependent enzyme